MYNLYQLYSELNTSKGFIIGITENPDKFYYRKIKPKMKFGKYQAGENGSVRLRHLIPPVQKLKIIQQKICNHLQKIELPNCMYGSVEGSNNIVNALLHVENKFFFKIDLKDFSAGFPINRYIMFLLKMDFRGRLQEYLLSLQHIMVHYLKVRRLHLYLLILPLLKQPGS